MSGQRPVLLAPQRLISVKASQLVTRRRRHRRSKIICLTPQTFVLTHSPLHHHTQFNVAITDHAEVTGETRRALGIKETALRDDRSIVPNLPLCVEISLKTEEGYDMLLEVWTLSIIQELNSPAIRASHTVYSSFGNLLKSIIAVSRATPAYKLSRRTSETYRITHSIAAGKPADLNKLGKLGFCVCCGNVLKCVL